jgi:hypothetical protein
VGQGRRAIIWAVAGLCSVGAEGVAAAVRADAVPVATPAPVFAHTVVLRPVSGRVLIRVPGISTVYVRLARTRSVPVGTVVDATTGRLSLTSANPTPGYTQTGQFFGGVFQIRQNRAGGGLVDLVLRDNFARNVCGSGAARAAVLSQRVLGLLRGVAKGRFRTTGRFSAATVRGTDWGVRDRCDGTLTVVRTGAVVVTDFRLHRTVVVGAGQTYLARAG